MTEKGMPDTWGATDLLGRTLPTYETVGEKREDKFVGIFYWTWHCVHAKQTEPHNVTKILEQSPEAMHDLNHPAWGKLEAPHHWNEPLFGYYTTTDRWVLRRHAELLADAGVDVVIFDTTNGTFTWRESYQILFEVFTEARADGVNVPKISFLLPFAACENTNIQLVDLYEDIYRDGKFQDLWFYWKGKPLLMAYPDALDKSNSLHAEIADFFTFRPGQPSYTAGQERPDHWGWLSVYPQQVYRNADGSPEQITVGVAQNHSAELGLTAMNGEHIFGRTYTSKGYDTRENAVLYGANFAEQFEYALQVDPEFIFVTGWNEWVAGRYQEWQSVINAFPDQCNDTFSRDIEPSAGKLGDAYYYQLVAFVRRFKGCSPLPKASAPITIHPEGAATQWDTVLPAYWNYANTTKPRDSRGYGTTYYTNFTGRNEIRLAKVAQDDENFYFMVQTTEPLSPWTDPAWMRLFLDTGNHEMAWEGYSYLINRISPVDGKATIERSLGGWNWEKIGEVDLFVKKNNLQLAIPKDMLKFSEMADVLAFKWSDHMQNDGNIYDFYQYGSVAPQGRFQYRYKI